MTGGPGEVHASAGPQAKSRSAVRLVSPAVYFASIMRRHMIEFGTLPEQFGAIAVACRRHANLNPEAVVMHGRPMTIDDYLAAPLLADPLRLLDSCLISDGGAAYVTTSIERARDLPNPPAVVAGVGEGLLGQRRSLVQPAAFTSTPQVFSRRATFAMAGLSPADVDVLTVYDPFTVVSMMQSEDMGFCPKGEAGRFVEGNTLFHDSGKLPFNTHGGPLSHAYVLGIAHVVECVKQLRGPPPPRFPTARSRSTAVTPGTWRARSC